MAGTVRRSRLALTDLQQWAVDLLLPPRCACCDADLPAPQPVSLCDSCLQRLGDPDEPFCQGCGSPTPPGRHGNSCLECSRGRFRFDSVVILGAYRGSLRDAILSMKHPQGEPLSRAIGRLLAVRKENQFRDFAPDCLIPVPMHWRRRVWRGVNSPQVLAEELSDHLGVVAFPGAVTRTRNTKPQKDLGHRDRLGNVRGAFALARGYTLGGARVAIVDDIMTSGATCHEIARVLKAAGAATVSAVVVGRAVLWA
ncbi:MAG: ComF family protein [Thermoguttaceae bacterium]